MSTISSQTKEEIDISAIINTFVYMDVDQELNGMYGSDLNTVMKKLSSTPAIAGTADYKAVMDAIEANPSLGFLKLVDNSHPPTHPKELINAVTFQDPSTNTIYVSYRGTGDGKWVDNGEGMTKDSTVMQDEAVKYFDRVMDTCISDEEKANSRIIVTGHSKGGNEAQFVTMTSKNRDLIDNCYSMDGQGFSSAAIREMKQDLGEDTYEEYLRKMYSICGENDYVHDLGHVIIPEDQTYFIPTPEASGFGGWHDIKCMLKNGGLNWDLGDYNQILHGDQGDVGILAKNISANMMVLDKESLNDAAISVMFLLELLLPYDYYNPETGEYDKKTGGNHWFGTGNRRIATPEELAGFADILFNSKFLPIVIGTSGLGILADRIEDALPELRNWVSEKVSQFTGWYNNNLNYGYSYANVNTYLYVDTTALNTYAGQLENINRRISNLDWRMDRLYWQIGLQGLWDLMRADALTGYSWRLRRCIDYLRDTARDFDTAESYLSSQL